MDNPVKRISKKAIKILRQAGFCVAVSQQLNLEYGVLAKCSGKVYRDIEEIERFIGQCH